MDPTEEAAWIKRVQRSMSAVRQWESRLPSPDPVEAGSSIATDDMDLPGAPAQSAAWYGISTAVEHLALVADLAKNELTLRPTAIFTTTRAALLGASQAVWVLSGSRKERRERALAVTADERKQHKTFLGGYSDDKFLADVFSQGLRADLDAAVKRLGTELDELAVLRKGSGYGGKFDTTRMMKEAATHLVARDGEDGEWLRLALSYEWRIASAGAHARAWPFFVRPTESTPLEGGGEIRRMTSSIMEVAQSYGAATLMVREAWRLWDLRRVAHT